MAAQQAPANHTVVDGDTLWDLAQRYYNDPFDWRQIWEANRAEVEDPNLILPGQVLTIPDGRMAQEDRAEVEVTVERGPGARPAEPTSLDARTVFFRDTADRIRVVRTGQADYVVVPRNVAFAAPWLIGLDEEPEHLAVIEGFAGSAERSETPRSYHRIRLSLEGRPPSVGSVLRTYRVTRTIDDVGEVVTPTGLVTVTDVTDEWVVALVTQEYHRIQFGDLVGRLPEYDLVEGEQATQVMDGPHAMIMGFAGFHELQDISSVAFLDVGRNQGIVIGDEFEYLNPDAGSNVVEGRLQVVAVRPGVASARVIGMADAVFEQGLVVRLSRKMR